MKSFTIAVLTAALMALSLVATPADACTGSRCDGGGYVGKRDHPPSWSTTLHRYVYVDSSGHYRNHTLSAKALRIVGAHRLRHLHAYWKTFTAPVTHILHSTVLPVSVPDTARRYRGAHGWLEFHWYGWKLGLDDWLVGKIEHGSALAGTILAGLGLLSHPALAFIGGMLVATGQGVRFCQKSDGGWSYLYVWNGYPMTGAWGCNPF